MDFVEVKELIHISKFNIYFAYFSLCLKIERIIEITSVSFRQPSHIMKEEGKSGNSIFKFKNFLVSVLSFPEPKSPKEQTLGCSLSPSLHVEKLIKRRH